MQQWSYKKPTEAGRYFVNLGDVVTQYSLEDLTFTVADYGLVDDKGVLITEYNSSYKFMPHNAELSADKLNIIGNADDAT